MAGFAPAADGTIDRLPSTAVQAAIAWGYGRAVVFASLGALVAEAALSAAVNVPSMQPTAGAAA